LRRERESWSEGPAAIFDGGRKVPEGKRQQMEKETTENHATKIGSSF